EVSSTWKPFARMRSSSGNTERISPTLAPCTHTSGPAGRRRLGMPRRSATRDGSSLPRFSRCLSSIPANGATIRVEPRYILSGSGKRDLAAMMAPLADAGEFLGTRRRLVEPLLHQLARGFEFRFAGVLADADRLGGDGTAA